MLGSLLNNQALVVSGSVCLFTWNNVSNTYPTWDSFPSTLQTLGLTLDTEGRALTYGFASTDNGADIPMYFDLPMRDLTGPGELVRVDAIESYWKRPGAMRMMDIILRTSPDLGDNGTEQTAQSFDINVVGRKLAKYFGQESRYVGLKHAITNSRGGDEFRGVTLYLYARSAPTLP